MKHDRNAYNAGCRCDVCRKASAAYMRERRQRKRGERAAVARGEHLSVVPDRASTLAPRPAGSLVVAWRAEIDLIPGAAEEYPGIVATVLHLAGLMDSGALPQVASQQAKEIKLLMAELRMAESRRLSSAAPTGVVSPQQEFFKAFREA